MSKKMRNPLNKTQVKKLAKKVVSENPIFIPEEPAVVGSPQNLIEDKQECRKSESLNSVLGVRKEIYEALEESMAEDDNIILSPRNDIERQKIMKEIKESNSEK